MLPTKSNVQALLFRLKDDVTSLIMDYTFWRGIKIYIFECSIFNQQYHYLIGKKQCTGLRSDLKDDVTSSIREHKNVCAELCNFELATFMILYGTVILLANMSLTIR